MYTMGRGMYYLLKSIEEGARDKMKEFKNLNIQNVLSTYLTFAYNLK